MACIYQAPSGSWKAVTRRTGKPTVSKTFHLKIDAEQWAWKAEDEIIRGVYIPKSHSEKTTIAKALDRYLKEITATKKPLGKRANGRVEDYTTKKTWLSLWF